MQNSIMVAQLALIAFGFAIMAGLCLGLAATHKLPVGAKTLRQANAKCLAAGLGAMVASGNVALFVCLAVHAGGAQLPQWWQLLPIAAALLAAVIAWQMRPLYGRYTARRYGRRPYGKVTG